MTDDWERELLAHRESKDEYLADSPHSPIPSAERRSFDGLDYFPPAPELRFVRPLHEHDDVERVTVETTADGVREYRRHGEFRFEVGGQRVSLQAYRAPDETDRFWLPFRDETSGEETYGAGRYLDLDADQHRTDEGWVVDFNYAYNPFCAYSDAYECPLIPMENWLDVRIEAGEKEYRP